MQKLSYHFTQKLDLKSQCINVQSLLKTKLHTLLISLLLMFRDLSILWLFCGVVISENTYSCSFCTYWLIYGHFLQQLPQAIKLRMLEASRKIETKSK